MASFTVTKRKNKTSTSWQHDVKHPPFKSGKKCKSGFKTKAEATNAAQRLIRDLGDGKQVDSNRLFKDYYKEWLKLNGKYELSPEQQYRYEHSPDLFLEHFGEDIRIKDITRSEYQKFISNYAQGRTSEVVRKVNLYLPSGIRDAVYDGYIKKDPTYSVKAEGTKQTKKEDVKFLTIRQYEELGEHFKLRTDKSTIMLYILLITGARFSEIDRVAYDDLPIAKGLIHLPGTKAENADRFVEVSKSDLGHIYKTIETHPHRIDNKLFSLSYIVISKVLNKAKKKYNINEDVTPYSLRHTHAGYLISKGIPIKYISKRLGHASIAITLDVYTHLLDEHKKEQSQRIREIFSRHLFGTCSL